MTNFIQQHWICTICVAPRFVRSALPRGRHKTNHHLYCIHNCHMLWYRGVICHDKLKKNLNVSLSVFPDVCPLQTQRPTPNLIIVIKSSFVFSHHPNWLPISCFLSVQCSCHCLATWERDSKEDLFFRFAWKQKKNNKQKKIKWVTYWA